MYWHNHDCISVFHLSATLLFLPLAATAANVNWTGTSETNPDNLADPTNWGGTLPTAADSAYITGSTAAGRTLTTDADLNFGPFLVQSCPTPFAIETGAFHLNTTNATVKGDFIALPPTSRSAIRPWDATS